MQRLLIVDDVELNRALLGEMFRTQYQLSEADNGKVAIEILEREHEEIAAVLLDLVMPELDGFGVLDEMIRRGWIGRIPVVMITAESSDSVMQKGYEMGAADIISKPFNPNIVRQRIRNVIEQYSYRNNLESLVWEQTQKLRRQSRELRENSIQLVDILSTIIEFKNTESVKHISNIRVLTRILLGELSKSHREYGLTVEMVEAASEAAAMHDVGKIAIPDHILNKPGKLTAEEYEIMKTHTLRGCEILEKIAAVRKLSYYSYCYEICRHHHERWDGRGYPDGLKGDEIPIWAQAVSLADVYDALTSKRVYKDAVASEKAVNMILNGECGVFNPILLECFLKILPRIEESLENDYVEAESEKREPVAVTLPTETQGVPDVSARTLRLLELERQRYRIMSDLSGEILFEYDLQRGNLTFSEKYQELTGGDLVISNIKEYAWENNIITYKTQENFYRALEEVSPENPSCKVQAQINLDGKGMQWYEVYIHSLWDMEYSPICISYLGKLINIDRRKREELRLQKAAERDPLTEIWNRTVMKEKVTGLISNKTLTKGAFCFIDIDDFKKVNDSFGHAFGDSILRRVAQSLRKGIRDTDFVARIGGDEFVMFFLEIGREEVEMRIDCILYEFRKEFSSYQISTSIGVAMYPEDGQDYNTLMQKADDALYQAKQQGKDKQCFYEDRPYARELRSHL